jgi:hypothetical protein
VFLPRINDLLDDSGRLTDADLLKRLRRQAEDYTSFVEKLKQTRLPPQ